MKKGFLYGCLFGILIGVLYAIGKHYGYKEYYNEFNADHEKFMKEVDTIRQRVKVYRFELDSAKKKQSEFFKTHQSCKPNQHVKKSPVYLENKRNAL